MYNDNDLFDKIDSGIIILDSGFEVIFWNSWMESRSLLPKSKTLGRKLNQLFDLESATRLIDGIMLAINNGQSSVLSDRFNRNFLPIYKDYVSKEVMDQKVKISRIKSIDGKKHCLIQIYDVSAANQRELYLLDQTRIVEEKTQELEHSNKMASLGRMASGIVHEINNPISIIKGYDIAYQLMKKKDQLDPEKIDDMFKKIQLMADRVTHIIKGLKIIAHKDTFEFNQLASIKTIIDESVELSKPKLENTNIIIESDVIPPEYEIWCDSIQISQIIINLISNSIDAIADHPSPWIYISAKAINEYYEIRIMDSGRGIAPENIKQIFDPFFTSKKVGKGTGLGLSISQKIAEAHKGQLYVDTNASNTTFVLKLLQSKYWS